MTEGAGERRDNQRHAIELKVEYKRLNSFFADYTKNISKGGTFIGHHIMVPKEGVAVHINAFNFPAWGLCEKAAVAWLCGLPVISKPATSSALVAYRIVELWAQAQFLPAGAAFR